MPEDVFGAHITHQEANDHFAKFIEIKQRCLPILEQELQGDQEALNYYCSGGVEDNWAFIFDLDSLTRIMNSIQEKSAQGVFIFNAAKHAGGSAVVGLPTLMVFPYKHIEAVNENDVEFEILFDDGEQFPGSGGGSINSSEPDNPSEKASSNEQVSSNEDAVLGDKADVKDRSRLNEQLTSDQQVSQAEQVSSPEQASSQEQATPKRVSISLPTSFTKGQYKTDDSRTLK